MKPEQVRERMELFGLGVGEKESDLFLRSVCDAYEDLYYQLVEKEDKVSTLNDAVKYYKNMENNMAQMLSTISEISEKTEHAAEKTAQLTIKEAESRADEILAEASEQAAQMIEDARGKAQDIIDQAEKDIADAKEEREAVKAESEAYALRFYELLEAQKAFFEEHRIDADVSVNRIRKIPNASVHKEPTMEELQAKIPEEIRSIPISDHTETLDEIIQSIKKSYEEVENS